MPFKVTSMCFSNQKELSKWYSPVPAHSTTSGKYSGITSKNALGIKSRVNLFQTSIRDNRIFFKDRYQRWKALVKKLFSRPGWPNSIAF